MSTLKTTNLQHPSAGSPAIVLDADGDATYAGVHDFSAATVTGAPQGLTKIAAISLSGSSVSFEGCFTSDYRNYRIVGNSTRSSATLYYRLLSGSTPQTGSNYSEIYVNATTSITSGTGTNTAMQIGEAATADYFVIDVFVPALAQNTAMHTITRSSEPRLQWRPTIHTVASAFDGCQFYLSGNTFTGGIITVYGLE